MTKNIFDMAKEGGFIDSAIAMEESEALRFTEAQGANLIDLDAKPLTLAQVARNALLVRQLEIQAAKLAFRKEKQAQDAAMRERKLAARERKEAQLLAMQSLIVAKFAKKE